ncbi:MAG TPA: hypothetical protein VLB69_05845 [Rudaea sp.]|nr:hypothetical protein [Rudaea sp.]
MKPSGIAVRAFIVAAALSLPLAVAAADASADRIPAGVKRIEPDRLAHYWLLDPASAQAANVPNSGYGLDTPTCAAVSYVVEKNGATSHVKLERVVPDGPLGKVAVGVVKALRYAAASQNAGKDPVATYVVMPFNLPAAASTNPADRAARARALDACKLDNFAGAPK